MLCLNPIKLKQTNVTTNSEHLESSKTLTFIFVQPQSQYQILTLFYGTHFTFF